MVHETDATRGHVPPADPLITGHRRLLDALAEFARDAHARPTGADGAAARALVAFLRQELLPFASREERLLASDPVERETTMVEHAFLAAEIDGLDAALGAAQTGEVARRIHRIEAVLEVHVARHEDRWRDGRAGAPSRVPIARREPAKPLDGAAIDALLRRHWWGVLSTVSAGRPWAVPVAYGMDGGVFYIASRGGRKVRNLRENPHTCLTVTEVVSGADWRCVVVAGRVEWVEGAIGAVHALRALSRQCGRPLSERAADATQLVGAKLMRIVPDEVTGRRREPGDGA